MFGASRLFVCALIIAPLAAACAGGGSNESASQLTTDFAGNPFSQSDPYTGGGYDTPLPKPVMKFTADTAGPLGPSPAFSQAEVQARLPGYQTASAETAHEDKVTRTLAVLHDGQQALQLFKGSGGRVSEIHAVSGIVAGPNNEQVGMSFRQAGMQRSNCRVGRNYWRGMAICPSKAASNVKLVFALPGYRGPFNKMPPESAIGDATLQKFVWIPKS